MRSYSFAILFGPHAPDPATQLRATHLPLLIRDEGPHGTLLGHFARANNSLAGPRPAGETLVVFPGPHSYVSPSLYTEPLSVPTWNYIAIHAYGTFQLIQDEDRQKQSRRRTDPGPRAALPRPLALHA